MADAETNKEEVAATPPPETAGQAVEPTAPAPSSEPVTETPAPSAPETPESPPSTDPSEAAKEASAAAEESAAAEAKPSEGEKPAEATEEPKHKPSLLAEAGKKEEKPKDAKPSKDAKKEEAKTPAAKEGDKAPEAKEAAKPEELPPIEYKPFKTPKEVTVDTEAMSAYTGVLGKYRVPQEAGQELLDMYTAEATKAMKRLSQHQWDTWNRTQEQWIERAQSDPEFGGNRMKTSLNRAGGVIELYGGSPEQIKELRDMLTYTGAGNHPALFRLFNNLGKALGEGKPIPAPPPQSPPKQVGRAARLYNGS